MDFYQQWIDRPKKRDRDHPFVKLVYKNLPEKHSPILITAEKPMPWNKGSAYLLVITAPPMYQVMSRLDKYLIPPTMIKEDYIDNFNVKITYITINDFINKFLDGDVRIIFQTNGRTNRIMYPAQWRLGPMMDRLRKYMLSQETFYRGINMLNNISVPYYGFYRHQMIPSSWWGFQIAFYRYWGKEGRTPTDPLIATSIDFNQTFDDMMFGVYAVIRDCGESARELIADRMHFQEEPDQQLCKELVIENFFNNGFRLWSV